jgi:predicted nucleic acid-binding protein
MIIDTSAWIDYLRANGSAAHLRLRSAFQMGEQMYMPHVVVQEILQGASSPTNYIKLQYEIERIPPYDPTDVLELHRQAAMLYARCRWQGLTPRSPMDCVVAACALEAELPLLANDRDFTVIARIEPKLKLLL